MSIAISICILTYNRCKSVMALLEGIYYLADNHTEIIVIDNNSNDGTYEAIIAQFKNVRCIKSEKNIGAAGRNIAFQNALGRVIICFDDDVFGLDSGIISRLLDKFDDNARLGAVNFKVLDAFSGQICNWVHHCRSENYSDSEFSTYEITEGAVAFRKEALDKSGYYDDMYFISHEGADLAFRIMREGYDCIYWGEIVVRHRHESTGRVPWLNYYYDTRNHIYLAVKHFPLRYTVSYLFLSLVSMLVYSVRDGYFRYWIKAVIDGLRNLPPVWRKRNVLPEIIMKRIDEINRNNASLMHRIKLRLFSNNARL